MKKILIFLMILTFLMSGCSNTFQANVFYIFDAYDEQDKKVGTTPFGSYMTLIGYNRKKVQQLDQEFKDETIRMHKLFDTNYYYKEDDLKINNLKVINDSYGEDTFIKVEDDLFFVLKQGIEFTTLSKGKFNIAIGSLIKLWDKSFDLSSPTMNQDPTALEVNEALKCVPTYEQLSEVLILNEITKQVKFVTLEGCATKVSLNLGGLAKGYAVEKIAKSKNFVNGPYLIDGGSSSIAAIGNKPGKKNWKILVPVSSHSPSHANEKLFQISTKGSFALSTSNGDIKGYNNIDGERRHHIIDATSGYSLNHYYSVTVVCDNSFFADIITTSITSMDEFQLREYLLNLQQKGIDVGLLLQVKEENQLVVKANDKMKSLQGDLFDIEILDF